MCDLFFFEKPRYEPKIVARNSVPCGTPITTGPSPKSLGVSTRNRKYSGSKCVCTALICALEMFLREHLTRGTRNKPDALPVSRGSTSAQQLLAGEDPDPIEQRERETVIVNCF